MLFAPSAKHAPALQEQLNSLQRQHDVKANSTVVGQSQLQGLVNNNNNVLQNEIKGKAEKSLHKPSQSDEIVEAMMKLDAKLVAYLAGEDMQTHETQLALGSLPNTTSISGYLNNRSQCEAFMCISAMKLQMEALTLQPEGTKRMELLQSEVRPIFTVECQLSRELIKVVPRYDMFHIMQFESEKFQSLTQCTRFGQEAMREIRLSLDDSDAHHTKTNFGRIHFCVWWREPGTCLNEMLGMGVLELKELYNAALLEQCKCITINRRGDHLANLYFKISLHLDPRNDMQTLQQHQLSDKMLINQCSDNNSKEEMKGIHFNDGYREQHTETAASAPDKTVDSASADNNNIQLVSSNFTAETSKVRLLKGFIYASETRNFEMVTVCDYILLCRRFWQEEAAATLADDDKQFNYQEVNFVPALQFAVLNDEKFLNRVDKQHIQLEVWRCVTSDVDGNHSSAEQVGVVRLPLHQFFIAYRDATITNHLCKGKMPVISTDAWLPVLNCRNNSSVGDLKCLLAIGSEEQITNLKQLRGFIFNPTISTISTVVNTLYFATRNSLVKTVISEQLKIKISEILNNKSDTSKTARISANIPNLLDKDLVNSTIFKPLQQTNLKVFKFTLDIHRAIGLPLNPSVKGKKNTKRNLILKRFPPNEAPSTYVAFQAADCQGTTYRSLEGNFYATKIIEKSTEPRWQSRFRVSATVDYLTNTQKGFFLRVWKKATIVDSTDSVDSRFQPASEDDVLIGSVALDLTAFARGIDINGWFSIVGFTGGINGQLGVRCQPLEDINKILHSPSFDHDSYEASVSTSSATSMDAVIDQFENSLDLSHLNLGQAIKRKYTELEDISQRLRTRLVHITGQEFPAKFNLSNLDNWQPLNSYIDNDSDVDLDEFERDINTAAICSPPASPLTMTIAQSDDNLTNLISNASTVEQTAAEILKK